MRCVLLPPDAKYFIGCVLLWCLFILILFPELPLKLAHGTCISSLCLLWQIITSSQMWWLKTTEMYSFTVPKPPSLRSRWGRVWIKVLAEPRSLWRPAGEFCPALPSFWWFQAWLVGCVDRISVPVCVWPVFFSPCRSSVSFIKIIQDNLTLTLHLQRPFFQMRPHS